MSSDARWSGAFRARLRNDADRRLEHLSGPAPVDDLLEVLAPYVDRPVRRLSGGIIERRLAALESPPESVFLPFANPLSFVVGFPHSVIASPFALGYYNYCVQYEQYVVECGRRIERVLPPKSFEDDPHATATWIDGVNAASLGRCRFTRIVRYIHNYYTGSDPIAR